MAEVRERMLALRLKNAKIHRRFLAAEKSELADLGDAIQLAENSEQLMQDIRGLGRVPKRVHGRSEADAWERTCPRCTRMSSRTSEPARSADLRKQVLRVG